MVRSENHIDLVATLGGGCTPLDVAVAKELIALFPVSGLGGHEPLSLRFFRERGSRLEVSVSAGRRNAELFALAWRDRILHYSSKARHFEIVSDDGTIRLSRDKVDLNRILPLQQSNYFMSILEGQNVDASRKYDLPPSAALLGRHYAYDPLNGTLYLRNELDPTLWANLPECPFSLFRMESLDPRCHDVSWVELREFYEAALFMGNVSELVEWFGPFDFSMSGCTFTYWKQVRLNDFWLCAPEKPLAYGRYVYWNLHKKVVLIFEVGSHGVVYFWYANKPRDPELVLLPELGVE